MESVAGTNSITAEYLVQTELLFGYATAWVWTNNNTWCQCVTSL